MRILVIPIHQLQPLSQDRVLEETLRRQDLQGRMVRDRGHPLASDGSTNKKHHAGQDEVGQDGKDAQAVGEQALAMKVLAVDEQGVGVGDGAEDEPLADKVEVVGREGAPGLEGGDGGGHAQDELLVRPRDQDGVGDVPPLLGRVLLMVAFVTLAEDLVAFEGVDE